jgi:DNA-binding NarL/FixJ family response regulator
MVKTKRGGTPVVLAMAHRQARGSSLAVDSKKPAIMVADDQLGLSAALVRFLNVKYRCLPLVTSLDELEPAMRHTPPDVLLLDVVFQHEESSIPRLRGLAASFPATGIIIHTGFPERAPVQAGLADGARGYLVKDDCDLPELVLALDTVLGGKVYLSPAARVWLARQPGTDEDRRIWLADTAQLIRVSGFSFVLAEVSLLRHQGLSANQIAARLRLSVHTVLGRLRRIREQYNLDDGALVLFVERALGTRRHRL